MQECVYNTPRHKKRSGEEAQIEAGLEEYQEAEYFLDCFRNPHVPGLSPGVEHALGFSLRQLREDFPSDSDHYRALVVSYPEISDKARDELERWLLDQSPDDEIPVLDILLMELHTMHTLLHTTHSEGRRGCLKSWSRSARASPRGSPIS